MTKYQKEDLIWEATRRSEVYKNFYNRSVDDEFKKVMAKEFFCLDLLADPDVDIDTIKEQVDNGADPKKVHPYPGFFEKKETPVTHHLIPDSVYQYRYGHFPFKQSGTEPSAQNREQFETWFDLFLNQMPGRILISIDPRSSDREIIDGMKVIKRKTVQETKAVVKEEKFSPRAYFPRDIGKYIGWLKMYDETVDTARKENFKLTVEGQILTLPEDFSFGLMVPNELMDDGEGPKFESVRRAYRDAYREATDLIKISPFISFSNSRAQK